MMYELPSASQLISRFRQSAPEACQLAEAVALAVRVEPELLRMARLRLHPDAPASAEAELWFSDLVEADNPLAMTLLPEVAILLRKQLHDSGRLDRAWEVLRVAHASAPPAIRLEEEINYWSVVGGDEAATRIRALLMQAVATLVDQNHGGLAHWALRLISRLPDIARSTDSAQMMGISAASQLGVPLPTGEPLAPEVRRVLPWLMPADQKTIRIGARLTESGAELSEPPTLGASHLEVPSTDPMLLEIRCITSEVTHQLALRRGEVVHIKDPDIPPDGVEIHTASGSRYELRPQASVSTSRVRILHLSDLRFTEDRHWQSDSLLRSLPEALSEFSGRAHRPHAVVITGDITRHGSSGEFERAAEWIEELLLPALDHLPADRVLVVPGNRDVHWTPDDEQLVRDLRERLRAGDVSSDATQKLVQANQRRFDAFANFASRYNQEDRVKADRIEVRFERLNSSWLASPPSADNPVGAEVGMAFRQAAVVSDDAVVIGLIHHPLSRIHDRDLLSTALEKMNCHLLLHGHCQNRGDATSQLANDGWTLLALGCGSLNGESPYRDMVQLVELGLPDWNVDVHYRVWREHSWHKIPNELGADTAGVARWNIDARMPVASSQGSNPPGRWVLIVGATTYQLSRKMRETASDLGSALARAGYGLITRGRQGVDHVCARSYCQTLAVPAGSHDAYLMHFVEGSREPDFRGAGRVFRFDDEASAWREASGRANAMILLGGFDEAEDAILQSLRNGYAVIGLGDTAEDSRDEGFRRFEHVIARARTADEPEGPPTPNNLQVLFEPAPGVVDRALLRLSLLFGLESPRLPQARIIVINDKERNQGSSIVLTREPLKEASSRVQATANLKSRAGKKSKAKPSPAQRPRPLVKKKRRKLSAGSARKKKTAKKKAKKKK